MPNNVDHNNKKPLDEEIPSLLEAYNRYLQQGKDAENNKGGLKGYYYAYAAYKSAHYFAVKLNDPAKINTAKTAINNSFAGLNPYEQFIEACHDFALTRHPHTRAEDLPNYLSEAIKTFYQGESPYYIMGRLRYSTLAALKEQLFTEINKGEMSAQKQEALWFALIPKTPLNVIFSKAQWGSTSLSRGMLNEVTKALITEPLETQAHDSNAYFPPRVIKALTNLISEERAAFMEELRQHAPRLYNTAPIELKTHIMAPTSRVAEVNSRQAVNVSTASTTIVSGKIIIPLRETDYVPL